VRREIRTGLAGLVTVVAMATVLVGTMQSSVPFVGPGELDAALEGRRVQLEGVVESITPEQDRLVIEVTGPGPAAATVSYAYAERRPLTLEPGRVVVAKGLYRDGVVEANQVSVRAHEQEH
jgi:cytochrome c-type biogenesis protein CcmE